MVTSMPETGVIGTSFIKASKHSDFGKVLVNNMDLNDSFTDYNNLIELIVTNSKTAMFHAHSIISETHAYRNCMVSKNLIKFFLFE